MSPFYKQVLEAWYKVYSEKPKNVEEFLNEVIWNNKHIMVDSRPLNYKKWIDIGIVQIKDLISCEGKILSIRELKDIFHINVSPMEYNFRVSALPKDWLHKLPERDIMKLLSTNNSFHDNVAKLKCSKVYWQIVEGHVKQPTALDHWISEFPFMHDDDFKDIFVLPILTTRDVKLQCFQYKLLHRIFPCNYMLSKWGITESYKCNDCNEVDTIEHYFFYCNKCRLFWKSVEEWFRQITNVYIPLKFVTVLFGIPHRKTQDECLYNLNFIIIHGKKYLYLCKMEQKPLHIKSFLNYIKYILHIDEEIALIKNKELEFERKWSFIKRHL